MNKSFLAGPSLHALVSDSPLEILGQLLASLQPDLILALQGADEPAERAAVHEALNQLPRDEARKLEDVARRVLVLGRSRGAETLSQVIRPRLSDADAAVFGEQLNGVGRSVWSFLHHPRLFEDAESLQYAVLVRSYERIYGAFDAPVDLAFSWTEQMEERLTARIVEGLGLEGPVRLSHLTLEEDGGARDCHVVIIRHGGDLESVAEHGRDGGKGWHYYRPSNEITLIYSPARGVVEVCAESPSLRQDAAMAFAEAGLGQNLSRKPLSFKLYNLARFRQSLSLPQFQPEGLAVASTSVVEVEARPFDPRHRLSLKVTPKDDIEEVIARLLKSNNIFRRAAITRVVIGVQYWPRDGRKTRALNITLSHPNRCNLRDQADPELRRLGYDLLEHWGILQALRTMTADDERALLPLLLDIYDLGESTLTEHDLTERGFDVASLKTHGFVEPAGRLEGIVIDDDDGGPDLVELRPGIGDMVEFDDSTGRSTWLPKALVTKFAVNQAWIEEIVLRQILPSLSTRAIVRTVPGLVLLGEATFEGAHVRCYLARGLSDVKTIRRIDTYLRGQSDMGVGIVLNAGAEGPECLGANVVVTLRDLFGRDVTGPAISMEALRVAFEHGKHRARGGMQVELVEGDSGIAVLYVPGRHPLLLTGADQVKIVRRLVKACRDGTLAIRTADLMDGTGSDAPSQAFADWKTNVSSYLTSPKKGFWQLAH